MSKLNRITANITGIGKYLPEKKLTNKNKNMWSFESLPLPLLYVSQLQKSRCKIICDRNTWKLFSKSVTELFVRKTRSVLASILYSEQLFNHTCINTS